MKRKILLALGLARPTLAEIRAKFPFPYEPIEQPKIPFRLIYGMKRVQLKYYKLK